LGIRPKSTRKWSKSEKDRLDWFEEGKKSVLFRSQKEFWIGFHGYRLGDEAKSRNQKDGHHKEEQISLGNRACKRKFLNFFFF
jgi:hypothetical protein